MPASADSQTIFGQETDRSAEFFATDQFGYQSDNTAERVVPQELGLRKPAQPRGVEAGAFEPPSSWDLSSSVLLKPVKAAPRRGWRKAVYSCTGGAVNLGDGRREAYLAALTKQLNAPLYGCHKIAVLSLKGGVGKTTVTAALGSTFASLRGDRVIAVDANPDRGTLCNKLPLDTDATVRDLLQQGPDIQRYSDVRAYTSQALSRLEVLASDTDPAVSEAFSADDYGRVLDVLERFYNLVLTDCGTGLMHSAMSGVLSNADALIIISSGSVDGARSASATMDWLEAHGYADLVTRSVTVINAARPKAGKVDLDRVIEHFARRSRTVRLLPFDAHLEEGAEIDMERLRPATRIALMELAATMAEGFGQR
ncbi:MinD-like ATPase involved in chromosome partitioning or flagellar assembly [Hoyosella altamirensis]|uniref:MinD-like ATPase involved in chromosome partitioning or flagellar assembly n=2 Tax=Hoyosella altamirensis TaxID=616997 RepID=A0A839RLX9_9ACTN|nr:MinD/ParA family protein [Hoyosella altamirensis]MBB3037735.1 MinD-like ATPase involved in chromosome partitioning or flagellar assembly [Hoyosella altamirensis]